MKYVWLFLLAFSCFFGGMVFKGWKLEKTYGVTPKYRATQFFNNPISSGELATWQEIVVGEGDMPFSISEERSEGKKGLNFLVDRSKITGDFHFWAPPAGSPRRVISLNKGGQ